MKTLIQSGGGAGPMNSGNLPALIFNVDAAYQKHLKRAVSW